MVAVAQDIFTEGIYTLEQGAHLARVQPRALRRWLDGEAGKEPALTRRAPKNEAGVLSFVDLVQVMAVRAIRQGEIEDRHTKQPIVLSLQKLRKTIEQAESFGIYYPFARKHKTYVFQDDIVIDVDGQLITVTGKYKRQHLIRPVVELYLEDLCFDAESGLANEYVPLRGINDERKVVIKPTVKYGAPVVMPCGYTVGSLVDAVDSEGSIEAAADMYDIKEEDVKLALRYEDMLAGSAS